MKISEWLSILALCISSGGLAIQIRNWLTASPRLHLSIIADARTFPGDDGKPKCGLTVINRGGEPTLLTHMVAFLYRSQWKKFRRKNYLAGVINSRTIPAELGVNKSWTGIMEYDNNLLDGRAKGHLYVGVIASHSNDPFLLRVPARRDPKIPERQIASG